MEAVCSFCGERPVVAWFEGPHFRVVVDSPHKVRSEEAWLACAACLALVEADDREGLAKRRVARIARKGRDDRSIGFTLDFLARVEGGLEADFWARRSASS